MITTPYANEIWNLFIGETKEMTGSGECYLGFSTSTPRENGTNFSEPFEKKGYARVPLNLNEIDHGTVAHNLVNVWGKVAEGTVSNEKAIVTPECTEDDGWGTFTHFGIFEHKEGGVPIAFDLLTDPENKDEYGKPLPKELTVGKNEVVVFRIGTLSLTHV